MQKSEALSVFPDGVSQVDTGTPAAGAEQIAAAVLRLVKSSTAAAAAAADPDLVSIDLARFRRWRDHWLADTEDSMRSDDYVAELRRVTDRLIWFVEQRQKVESISTDDLRAFISYVSRGHEATRDNGPRWDCGRLQASATPTPNTVYTYFSKLRTFYNWLLKTRRITANPFAVLTVPKRGNDQIQPFRDDHVSALLDFFKTTGNPERDRALFLLLIDTGLRAEEVAGITMNDIDTIRRRITVKGKGAKRRTVTYAKTCSRAILSYLDQDGRSEGHTGEHLFLADRGPDAAARNGLTYSGIYQIFDRAKPHVKLKNVRVSPHTCRHTFAINFLRAGANIYLLQAVLGHTDLKMCKRYLEFVEGDLDAAGASFSPADYLARKSRGRD